jgi:RecB family exonuclease
MDKFNIKAIPFSHPDLDQWRYNFTGVRFKHSSGIILFGAVDDLWINDNEEIHVVDYKSTSTSEEITLDGEYKAAYKRQIEIYQYLLEHIGLKISKTGYFVYANARKDLNSFDEKLIFDMKIIPYTGDNSWVEGTVGKIVNLLESEDMPLPSSTCKYCNYIREYNNSINNQLSLF